MSYHRDKDRHIRAPGAIAWRDGVGARFPTGAPRGTRDLQLDTYKALMTSPSARMALGMINTTRGDDGSTGVTTGGGTVPTGGRPRVRSSMIAAATPVQVATVRPMPGLIRPITTATTSTRPVALIPIKPSRPTSIGVAAPVVPIDTYGGGGGGGGGGGSSPVEEIPPPTPEVEDPIIEPPAVVATGMSGRTKVLIGVGALIGLYYLSKKG